MKGDVLVGQSSGLTAVINSSLAGVFKAAEERGYQKVYGMRFGIQGFLDGQYVDLSGYIRNELELELLKRTPSALLGTCRYKLPEIHEDERVFDKVSVLLDKLGIEVFIYIDSNDSMDTVQKLSNYALLTGAKQRFVDCPETIDNDLAITDHTLGFGSAAKCIAALTEEVIHNALDFSYEERNVSIIEIMERNTDWLVGVTALMHQRDCDGPDLIYLPEVSLDIEAFVERVTELPEERNVIVAAVSEGIWAADGTYAYELADRAHNKNTFGHIQMTSAVSYLTGLVHKRLDIETRTVELSTLQCATAHPASRVDMDETFTVGGATVEAADKGSSGMMVVIGRVSNDPYQSAIGVCDVHRIANDEKLVPCNWIDAARNYVADEFMSYVEPLIQGHYNPMVVAGLPRHLVMDQENYNDYQIWDGG